jgi:hypothetical protein
VHRFLALIAIAALVLAACGGGSNDDQPAAGSVSKEEVRATIEGVLRAALNGDAAGFSSYLAASCQGKEDLTRGVGLLRSLLGGLGAEGEISVRVPDVEFDAADANHVTVTGLPGLELLVDDEAAEDGVATGIANVSLKLVREGGAWKIEGCED